VNAADYVVWRNCLGTIYTQADYNTWRTNFGETTARAVTATVGSFGNTRLAVPEVNRRVFIIAQPGPRFSARPKIVAEIPPTFC
jgi:hypothetical protein